MGAWINVWVIIVIEGGTLILDFYCTDIMLFVLLYAYAVFHFGCPILDVGL